MPLDVCLNPCPYPSVSLLACNRINMKSFITGLATSVLLLNLAQGQDCQTTTLQDSVPTNGDNVLLSTYSYCGGTLNTTAYINNLAYNKQVTLYYTDREGNSTPLSSVGLGYQSGVDGTNYELWSSSSPAYVDGVQQLLNLTYVVVDLGMLTFFILMSCS